MAKKTKISPRTHELIGTYKYGTPVSKRDLGRDGKKAVKSALRDYAMQNPETRKRIESAPTRRAKKNFEKDLDQTAGSFWRDWKNRNQK